MCRRALIVLALLVSVALSLTGVSQVVAASNSPLTDLQIQSATDEFAADLRASGYQVDSQTAVSNNGDEVKFVVTVAGCGVEVVQSMRNRINNVDIVVATRNGRAVMPFLLHYVYADRGTRFPVVNGPISPSADTVAQFLLDKRRAYTCARM